MAELPLCWPIAFADLAPPSAPVAELSPWLWVGGGIFLVLALFLTAWWLFPLFSVQVLLWLAHRFIYRIKVLGRDHVPKTGGALIVCNHVTFIDWLLLSAALPRQAHFLVFAGYSRHWIFGRILKAARAIPVDGSAGPRSIMQALRAAAEAVKNGELVCIFAEGGADPHRLSAAVPARLRADHQEQPRADRAGVPRPCLGEHLQLSRRQVLLEVAAEASVSGHVAFGKPLPPTSDAPSMSARRSRSCPPTRPCARSPTAGRCIASSSAWRAASVSPVSSIRSRRQERSPQLRRSAGRRHDA